MNYVSGATITIMIVVKKLDHDITTTVMKVVNDGGPRTDGIFDRGKDYWLWIYLLPLSRYFAFNRPKMVEKNLVFRYLWKESDTGERDKQGMQTEKQKKKVKQKPVTHWRTIYEESQKTWWGILLNVNLLYVKLFLIVYCNRDKSFCRLYVTRMSGGIEKFDERKKVMLALPVLAEKNQEELRCVAVF